MTAFLEKASYPKDANDTNDSAESKPEHIKEAATYVFENLHKMHVSE